jgi:hypothetical protein
MHEMAIRSALLLLAGSMAETEGAATTPADARDLQREAERLAQIVRPAACAGRSRSSLPRPAHRCRRAHALAAWRWARRSRRGSRR